MSRLTVVMPVYNEAADLPSTIDALVAAVDRSEFDVDVLLVDDGSSDGSAQVAEATLANRLPLQVLSQPNLGRFQARRRGVEAATGDWILLLDGRVRIDSSSLVHLQHQLDDAPVWTGHVDVAANGDLLGSFWRLIAELAWADYFDDPREASFGTEEFDRFPKGTTCFLAPRALLLDAIAQFQSRYRDLRDANDDTQLLRWIADRARIHVSPAFRCEYQPRTSLSSFVRHAVHRGVVFLDGHGRRESRFFPLVVAFYPLSAVLVVASFRKPLLAPAALVAGGLAAAAFGLKRRRTPVEVASLAFVTPVYALAHGYGMWRGLARMLRQLR